MGTMHTFDHLLMASSENATGFKGMEPWCDVEELSR